jgi:hypothetical protein
MLTAERILYEAVTHWQNAVVSALVAEPVPACDL